MLVYMYDNEPIYVDFWFIQKFIRGKSVEKFKIWDDPIQIANNKSRIRIIDTTQLRFHISKLLSSFKVKVW